MRNGGSGGLGPAISDEVIDVAYGAEDPWSLPIGYGDGREEALAKSDVWNNGPVLDSDPKPAAKFCIPDVIWTLRIYFGAQWSQAELSTRLPVQLNDENLEPRLTPEAKCCRYGLNARFIVACLWILYWHLSYPEGEPAFKAPCLPARLPHVGGDGPRT